MRDAFQTDSSRRVYPPVHTGCPCGRIGFGEPFQDGRRTHECKSRRIKTTCTSIAAGNDRPRGNVSSSASPRRVGRRVVGNGIRLCPDAKRVPQVEGKGRTGILSLRSKIPSFLTLRYSVVVTRRTVIRAKRAQLFARFKRNRLFRYDCRTLR